MRSRTNPFFLLASLLLAVSCGLHMEQISLRDEWGGSGILGGTSKIVMPVFNGYTPDAWGLEKNDCKNFRIEEDNSAEKNAALHLTWDKTGKCEWTGMGIGWNGWAPKDLTELMSSHAITFDIRSVKEKSALPVMIFLLEDYGNVQSAGVLRAADLERYPITNKWQKASIPLSAFQKDKTGTDFSNIRQLLIEFQGAGDVVVDNMKIEPGNFSGNATPAEATKKGLTVVQKLPLTLFDEEQKYTWAFGPIPGKEIRFSNEKPYSGRTCLELKWDQEAFKTKIFEAGWSWDRWNQVAIHDTILSGAVLTFAVRPDTTVLNSGTLELGFEAYWGMPVFTTIEFPAITAMPAKENGWRIVQVPLSSFGFKKTGFDTNRFKGMMVRFKGKGHLWLDDIQLITRSK